MELKPFEEEPEDAAKWSSINKLAAQAAACQVIDMGLGLVARVLKSNLAPSRVLWQSQVPSAKSQMFIIARQCWKTQPLPTPL